MPMFIRRLTVLGASLVCSVESTRWPVSAALTAISAVSKSRISPTRMMFGSWRRNDAQRGGEVQADALAHLHLVDAGEVELDRVLGGHDVGFRRVDLARSTSTACSSCRCRSGPVTSTMPHGLLNRRLELDERLGLEPELRHVEHQLVLVEQTHDDLFAEERRQHRDAEVDLLRRRRSSLKRILMRPSCGSRFSAMSSFDMILMRERDRVAELHRRAHDVVENPVDAVPDAQLLLVRLDVDVARALLNRRHQHDVHQPDDRRFLALLGERLGADLLRAPRGPRRRRRSSVACSSSSPWLAISSALGPLGIGAAGCERRRHLAPPPGSTCRSPRRPPFRTRRPARRCSRS